MMKRFLIATSPVSPFSKGSHMFRLATLTLAIVASALVVNDQNLQAEIIQLNNGDVIQADLLQVTEKTLRIRHEIFGELEIPRARVRAIVMADPKSGKSKKIKPDGTEAEQETPKEIIDRLVNKDFGPKAVKELEKDAKRQSTPQDAVEQLRREGLDPNLQRSLHLLLPGFGAPEVQGYFNDRVDGLMKGSITIQDIRKDAVGARDQLRELMDDLGQDGAALQGYYSILDNFIEKTKPAGEEAEPKKELPRRKPAYRAR